MGKHYHHLTPEEHAEITVWKRLKKKALFIANKIGRARSTVENHMKSGAPSNRKKKPRKTCAKVSKRRSLVFKYVEEMVWETVRWKVWEGTKREAIRERVYVKPKYPTVYALGRVLFEKHKISVKLWNIWSDLRFGGYHWRKRQKVVTMNPQHWEQRFTFCKEIWPLLKNPHTLLLNFADECAISMAVDSTMVFHYRRKDQPALPRWVGRASGLDEKVHIWACIGPGYRKMVMFDSTVNQKVYVEHCLNAIWKDLKAMGATLIQDNAKDFLYQKGCFFLELSPFSPDLNVIEQLWIHLKRRVSARYPTRENFKRVIAEEFAAIPQSTIDGICASFPSRVERVIKNKGKHFRA